MITIITYSAPHRKTQDVIYKLLLTGRKDIHVLALPFNYQKKHRAIYQHRPQQCYRERWQVICENLGIKLTFTEHDKLNELLKVKRFRHILIGGCGLLPENIANEHMIVNSHPGYLPDVRGLDALKWAILKGKKIGVTTHYISSKADSGLMIERKEVPVYFEDSFHSLALRVYQTEINLLVNAIFEAENIYRNEFIPVCGEGEPFKRMPNTLENLMMEKFNQLRIKAPSVHDCHSNDIF